MEFQKSLHITATRKTIETTNKLKKGQLIRLRLVNWFDQEIQVTSTVQPRNH